MAGLAAQLGLPLWFIELRHAATHEDLPSLLVLRDAAKQVSFFIFFEFESEVLMHSNDNPGARLVISQLLVSCCTPLDDTPASASGAASNSVYIVQITHQDLPSRRLEDFFHQTRAE